MDRENADFQKAWIPSSNFQTQDWFPSIPWVKRVILKVVIDLLTMKAYKGTGKESEAIPADYQAKQMNFEPHW